MPPEKGVKLGEPSQIDKPISPRFPNDQGTFTAMDKGNLLSSNGSLTERKDSNEELTKVFRNKNLVAKNDPWWLTLPQVLVRQLYSSNVR